MGLWEQSNPDVYKAVLSHSKPEIDATPNLPLSLMCHHKAIKLIQAGHLYPHLKQRQQIKK